MGEFGNILVARSTENFEKNDHKVKKLLKYFEIFGKR